MNRTEQTRNFINAAGWGGAKVTALAGDASNRRYDRLTKADGSSAVLMDAPPEKGENVRPFVAIATSLSALGLSAPRIYHGDCDAGFLLIEDLGDRLFAREIAANPKSEETLYAAAIDVLTHLHKSPCPTLKPYESSMSGPLAALAYDWYQLGATGRTDQKARQNFLTRFIPLLQKYDSALDVLIQRDYHAENLLWLPERSGVARVGLLDFQDAMCGHRAYDLVSVLQDARRAVPENMQQMMKQRFVTRNCLDPETFETAYAVFGLQRNLRILGVFTRLCLRHGKAHYVDLIPRVWSYVQANLQHAATCSLAALLDQDLPAPDAEVLARLKLKCGTCTGP
jgi:hypothetical protein